MAKHHSEDCVLFDDKHRDSVRTLVDSRIWVAIGKYSSGLFVAATVLFSMSFYTYNQGEKYSGEKLNKVIASQEATQKTMQILAQSFGEVKFSLMSIRKDLAFTMAALEEEKKNREQADMDIKRLITTLGNN